MRTSASSSGFTPGNSSSGDIDAFKVYWYAVDVMEEGMGFVLATTIFHLIQQTAPSPLYASRVLLSDASPRAVSRQKTSLSRPRHPPPASSSLCPVMPSEVESRGTQPRTMAGNPRPSNTSMIHSDPRFQNSDPEGNTVVPCSCSLYTGTQVAVE